MGEFAGECRLFLGLLIFVAVLTVQGCAVRFHGGAREPGAPEGAPRIEAPAGEYRIWAGIEAMGRAVRRAWNGLL